MDPTQQPTPAPRDDHAPGSGGGYTVRFSKRRIVRGLGIVVAVILVLHLGVHIWHYKVHEINELLRGAVNVDEEENFPTWYSSASLLFAGALAGLIAARARARHEPLARYWQGICLALVFMSADEVAGFHELLNSFIKGSWTVPFAILTAAFVVAYIPFILRVDRTTARRLAVAAVIYVAGALVLEKFTDYMVRLATSDLNLLFYTVKVRHPAGALVNTLDYAVETFVEEGLEMLGVLLAIRTFLLHLGPEDELRFSVPGPPREHPAQRRKGRPPRR